MKKVILAIGMILPMMSLQAKLLNVTIKNVETVKVSGLGNVSVIMNEIDNSTEIAVTVTFGVIDTTNNVDTTVISNSKQSTSQQKMIVYSSGNSIIIESVPNVTYTISSIDGKILSTGKLDSDGKGYVENILSDGIYLISIGNKISGKISK